MKLKEFALLAVVGGVCGGLTKNAAEEAALNVDKACEAMPKSLLNERVRIAAACKFAKTAAEIATSHNKV